MRPFHSMGVPTDSCTGFHYYTGENLILMDGRTYRVEFESFLHPSDSYGLSCSIDTTNFVCIIQKLNCVVSVIIYVSPAGIGAPVSEVTNHLHFPRAGVHLSLSSLSEQEHNVFLPKWSGLNTVGAQRRRRRREAYTDVQTLRSLDGGDLLVF